MKRKKQLLITLLALYLCIPFVGAQNKQEKLKQQEAATAQLVASGNYKINVHTALPMNGRSVSLSSLYSLSVKNDSVFSSLPYFGRAYRIPYGGGEGLNFKTLIQQYQTNIDKKGNHIVTLTAKTPEDTFDYQITIYPNGTASLHVNMQNRQSISFLGELDIDSNSMNTK